MESIITPPERVDDLSEWENVNDVESRLRDLPAAYAIPERGWNLPDDKRVGQLVEQYKNPETDTQKKEAASLLGKIQLILLNLMLHSSGFRSDEPVTTPVKQWDIRMLIGDRSQRTNFGNRHEVSRIPEDTGRLATPVSPGEGWMYRMIDYKENFLTVVRSLRYFAPTEAGAKHAERSFNSEKAVWARKLIAHFMGESEAKLPELGEDEPII